MATQIQLAWTVSVDGTSFSAAKAATALGAVVLYESEDADPVLGQALGLTVASDETTTDATTATRTLTLNMTATDEDHFAPPPFPCHPTASTPPELPYKFERSVPLPGFFTANPGNASVNTTTSQLPSLSDNDTVQFSSQIGVDYTVQSVSASAIVLTDAYNGGFANTQAFKRVAAPAKLPAIFSTSSLDNDTDGSGARTIAIDYTDSAGNSDSVSVNLDGKRPVQIAFDPGTIDIAIITGMRVSNVGDFQNSVGQITLVDLSEAITDDDTDDQAMMKIDRHLVYLPPSYFALAQQSTSRPTLEGNFFVTTGSPNVVTETDQTSTLSPGDEIQFAAQLSTNTPSATVPVIYTVQTVSPKLVVLTKPFTGFSTMSSRPESGTKSLKTVEFTNYPTAAFGPSALATPPSDTQLKTLLAQYVNPGNCVPPPSPPLAPQGMTPDPTLLSGFFTQTISLALAMPVTSSEIVLV